MYMEFTEITGTLRNVRVGDVVYKGLVCRVAEPSRTRSGSLLMVISIDHGNYIEQWVVEPEREAIWKRPV